MKINELTFSWDEKFQAGQEAACNLITMEELWDALSPIYDSFKFEESYMKDKVTLSSWEDQDGWFHLIFVKDGEIKDSDRKCYNEFYNNTFGSGIFCARMSSALYKHKICRTHVQGFEAAKIDQITVLSWLRCNFHSNYVYLMRLLMDWMYLTEV